MNKNQVMTLVKTKCKTLKFSLLRLFITGKFFLKAVKDRFLEPKNQTLGYNSLSAIDTRDTTCEYLKALKWALDNREKEDIKNIALTGPYGAGKSTILKTFQKNLRNKKLKFLSISLATFKEEKPLIDNDGNEVSIDKTELLRRIETSILEQIFYHEKDNKIPDSRFKKIKSYSNTKIFFHSVGYILFLLAIYNFLHPYFIQGIFKDIPFNKLTCDAIHYIGITIIVFGIFFIMLKSIRIISAITLNKLEIQNAEIGIGENLNKSVLNHHIDELLYFFSATGYNVVIIEDLDRFQETEIFTKLREINLLLNNSKKTKRKPIVFVYAVRDDMFTDKERTKFFDFIIPVIPHINSSNSSEILQEKNVKFGYNLSENFIEDISFFIDDMRLLHNISNEFYLYSKKLNETLDHDKLFAIITYKNIYPNDFMKLSCNEGDLYNIINLKTDLIKNSISDIDIKIEEIKEELNASESLFIDNIKDLRLLYLIRILESLPGFVSFTINNDKFPISAVIENDKFEYIKTNKYKYVHSRNYNEYPEEPTKKFNEIEKIVDQFKSYSEREKEILDVKNGKINTLKNKILDLEKQKLIIRTSKIAGLITSNQLALTSLSTSQSTNFINTLLRNRYITEDYIDYISLFHEGTISRADYQFHISIKNETKQPFTYKLSKLEKLILKINPLDFQTEYILNYDILDYLLSNPNKYDSELKSIFNKLKDESKTSVDFIKSYFETSLKLAEFIGMLCNNWNNIWSYVESNTDFTDTLKTSFFKSIIEYGSIDDIVKISKQSSFENVILSDPLFLNIIDNDDKLQKVIEGLEISFNSIDFENSSDEMLLFIYNGNHYDLNIEMVTSIIKKFGEFDQVEFDNSNYAAIKTSKADQLIECVDDCIDFYIENVYLKISANVNEKEEYLVDLLNNDNIEIYNRNAIISQSETKITNLYSIEDSNLNPLLLENNKIHSTWENLFYAFNNPVTPTIEDELDIELKIPESIIHFINIEENAELLSKVKIPKPVNEEYKYLVFYKQLLQNNDIEDQSYALTTKSSPWWYNNLSFEKISDNKIKSLIDNNLVKPTVGSFDSLKENSDGLNIYLFGKRKNDYFKLLDELTFDNDDLELILKSAILSNYEKQKILSFCTEETILTDENLKLLSSIILNDNTFIIESYVLEALLNNNHVPVIERIHHYNKNYTKFNIDFIEKYLENLGGSYANINNKRIKAKLDAKAYNEILLENLKTKGYLSSISLKNDYYTVNHKRN